MRNMIKTILAVVTFSIATSAHAACPTLLLKNQFGEQSNNCVIGGTASPSTPVSAHTIQSNLSGSSAVPSANSVASVSAALAPTQVLTGFSAGAGTVVGTDTVIGALQKIVGNDQNLPVISNLLTGYSASGGTVASSDSILGAMQKVGGNIAAHQANSTAPDVATLVTDFNALLAKLQAAHLMQ